MENIIGTHRKIPKGKVFWSVGLQENVKADRDIYIEITNTCIGNTFVFGFKVDKSFLSNVNRNVNFEIMVDINKTEEYILPVKFDWHSLQPVYGYDKLLSDTAVQSNVGQNLAYDAKFIQDIILGVDLPENTNQIDYFSLMTKVYGHKPINEMNDLEKVVSKIDFNSRFPIAVNSNYVFAYENVSEDIIESGKQNTKMFDDFFRQFMKSCQIPSHIVESMIGEENQTMDKIGIPEKILIHKKIFK